MKKKLIIAVLLTVLSPLGLHAAANEYHSITGKVIDEVTKKGVEGVEVTAELGTWEFHTTTNELGVYVLKNLLPETYTLKFSKENSPYEGPEKSHMRVVVRKKKDVKNANYVLKRGCSITGAVYGADGVTPMAGISVEVFHLDFWKTLESKWHSGVTDSDGKFFFYGLPAPNNAVVVIDIPGHASVKRVVKLIRKKPDNDLKFIITWDDVTGISGFVTSAAKVMSLADIEVELRDRAGNLVGSALTDLSGKFSIVGVAPGSYQAGAFLPGIATITKTVEILRGKSTNVEFIFEKKAPAT